VNTEALQKGKPDKKFSQQGHEGHKDKETTPLEIYSAPTLAAFVALL
jgi:hypothetical protein